MTDIVIDEKHELITVEAFERFADAPENAGRRFELIYGEITEKVPTEEHSVIALKVGSRILVFIEITKIGGRAGVEPRHRIKGDEHNARMPDVAYTSAARMLPITKKGSVPQMPDLCIEIKSPGDTVREMRDKAYYYLTNGARLVWLAFPATKKVEVCTLNAEGVMKIEVLDENDTLDGGKVLPGFTLAIKDVFDVE